MTAHIPRPRSTNRQTCQLKKQKKHPSVLICVFLICTTFTYCIRAHSYYQGHIVFCVGSCFSVSLSICPEPLQIWTLDRFTHQLSQPWNSGFTKSLSSTNTHAQAFQFITDSCKSESWTKATLRPLCRWRKTSHRPRAWGRRRLRQRGTSNQDNQPETKDILANITFNTVCTVFQIWPGGLIISSLKVFRMVRNLFMTSFFF